MAINLYIRLVTTASEFGNNTQHCKETYRFIATGDDAGESIENYRIRHFLTSNTSNSTVRPNSGLCVYDGTGTTPLTGSYNDWCTPDRPPKLDGDNSRFNTELMMRFDTNRTFAQMPTNSEAWISVPRIDGYNGSFSPMDVESSFSFLGYSENGEYVKNPMNVVLERKVSCGDVSRIYTEVDTLPVSGSSDCDSNDDINKPMTVVVETGTPHGLSVGDAVTIYSRSVSHVPSYTGTAGRLFGKSPGERYLGDFRVVGVPTDTSFSYRTYHNPMKINESTHPEYTHADWDDLVWEKWALYEYSEQVSAKEDGSSVVLTFAEADPVDCRRNFAVGDTIVFDGDGTMSVHMVVSDASLSSGITVVPMDGETYPSGTTGGKIVYTPRMPSSGVAFNLSRSDVFPRPVENHANNSALFYACQDTYYVQGGADVSHGNEDELNLVRGGMIPVMRFPLPYFNGCKLDDSDLVAKLFLYATGDGGVKNNRIELIGCESDGWVETDSNGVVGDKLRGTLDGGGLSIIGSYSYSRTERTFVNRYVGIDVDCDYVVKALTGDVGKSVMLDSSVVGSPSNPIRFASRDDDDGQWPYIAISSAKYIGESPFVETVGTCMYIVCDSIEHDADGSDVDFVAKVSEKHFDPTSNMYVRTWSEDMPFFAVGDSVEIMNIPHYGVVEAVVTNVDYAARKMRIKCPTLSESGFANNERYVVRNKSRLISSYSASNADDNPMHLSVDGPVNYGKRGYAGSPVEFDAIHASSNSGSPSLRVAYADDDRKSNELGPVIITDIAIEDGFGGMSQPDCMPLQAGPKSDVILKGFNFSSLSSRASAVLGHSAWEDGVESGVPVPLQPVLNRPNERKFHFDTNLNVQRSMPVYGVRNVDGVTEFKLRDDDFPFYGKGDVLSPVYTGRYVDSRHTPSSSLNYGSFYYVGDNVKIDGEYVWLRLSSSYVRRDENLEPTYVSLDDSEVEHLNSKIPSGVLGEGDSPLTFINAITSVAIKDYNVDTTAYCNRMYMRIDGRGPICHVDVDLLSVGQPFNVYISDLNDIATIDGKTLREYDVDYLLGNTDARFVRVLMRLEHSRAIDILDAVGNSTTLVLNAIGSDIYLSLTGVLDEDDCHVLNFVVSCANKDALSTKINAEDGSGVWATLGESRLDGSHFRNVGGISTGDHGVWQFGFDLTICDDELAQSDGHLAVFSGDTVKGDGHHVDSWSEPIIFKKTYGCVNPGDVLRYSGINLYETNGSRLTLRGKNADAVSICGLVSATSVSVEVVAQSTSLSMRYAFGIKWSGVEVSAGLAYYLNEFDIVPLPTIDIYPESNKDVKLKKGTAWEEPSPSDIVATDGNGADISESVVKYIDNPNWAELGEHTITYVVTDEYDRLASVSRKVFVTECNIPIATSKSSYDINEDVSIMIAQESMALFNQNCLNNVVEYRASDEDEWNTATILSGTADRKSLVVKNPGFIASGVRIRVHVGEDNIGADQCYMSDEASFDIVSTTEQDKAIGAAFDSSSGGTSSSSSSSSRFSDLNFEPVYTKDLSYSSFSITSDENSLMQNVYSILLTNLGERLYDDEFGSTLEESVFEIIDDLNGDSKLLNQCITLINKYEPRVAIVEDKSYVSIGTDNTVAIVLYVKVPRGVARKIELTFRKSS